VSPIRELSRRWPGVIAERHGLRIATMPRRSTSWLPLIREFEACETYLRPSNLEDVFMRLTDRERSDLSAVPMLALSRANIGDARRESGGAISTSTSASGARRSSRQSSNRSSASSGFGLGKLDRWLRVR
jgi:hypothetical protein